MEHTFHIPVLGLAFSVDTPLKVAQYGISSVISIVDDELLERMRAYYCKINNMAYNLISVKEDDSRAKRITSYLNLVHDLVQKQITRIKSENFDGEYLSKYVNLLPDHSKVKSLFNNYQHGSDTGENKIAETVLKDYIQAGQIDVNIMSKVDKANVDANGDPLGPTYSDASAALRGFANSNLNSSLIISAGLNPRLFSYLAEFDHFLPDEKGSFAKKIVLKVSDYRSAHIQAKILAKKGIWVSEFRIESGLNCGGHAFATEGLLLGPILQEFKDKKADLRQELYNLYVDALRPRGITVDIAPSIQISVQGGIGHAQEQDFLLQYYQVDRTGWGSPFLLVPEATTVDDHTLQALCSSTKEDYYISDASPLGVPFNNFRSSTAEAHRLERIKRGRPGAPCTKKYLVSNTEFGQEPICTASRQYQHLKLKQLEQADLSANEKKQQEEQILAKTCLCEGLATAAYVKYDILEKKENNAVAICPGPNTAYFDKQYTLSDMVDHIYGRKNLLKNTERPHMFINELMLYITYLNKYVDMHSEQLDAQKEKYIRNFKNQLDLAITYYFNLESLHSTMQKDELQSFFEQLHTATQQLKTIGTVCTTTYEKQKAII